MTAFALRVDDDIDLVLRGPWTDSTVTAMVERNLDRLRLWEPWAQDYGGLSQESDWAARGLHAWVESRKLPTVIRLAGTVVGILAADIEADSGVAQLGYWLDREAEGRGLVTRAARVLIDYLFARYPLERIEIRVATHNVRSRAVAERLGFTHEGTLRSAFPVGAARHDEAVYGLLRTDLG